jgi:hypothetical protein
MGTPIVAADSSWGPDGKKIIAYIKTESAGVGSEGSIIMIEFTGPFPVLSSHTLFMYNGALFQVDTCINRADPLLGFLCSPGICR